ncbi:alpha/beta hydrolase [Streptomyces dioscori]|uniref:Alpha/beta hydrolase n=1 Tax=Streptomyces dioscori TaxID=2109333 RepID=A0A2P8Q9N0_9ACTN|nr:alpha/beta fold hydrolase [Streptomyces dioscori]PSM42944.1 alpha/beta hydrolase [Streptomyces dioscori]
MSALRGPVLLVHGFFHGAWCWSEVSLELAVRGVGSVAVDLPGHGLRARRPAASTGRPYAPSDFASEMSPIADVDLDAAAMALAGQARRIGRGEPVTAVAHSMGGAVLTRAAERHPALFGHLVYAAAYMPASGVPCIVYPSLPEAAGEQSLGLLAADPVAVGALRVDTGADAQRSAIRSAFYGGVEKHTADAAIALLGCESPTAMATQPTTLTEHGWGAIPRTYVLCSQDNTIPVALQRLFVTQADSAFPQNTTHVVTLESAHSPFLSMPDRLAAIIARVV